MSKNWLFEENGFTKFYPGVWTEREKPYFEAFFAENRKLNERGPFDIKKLIAGELDDLPGYAGHWTVTGETMDYFAALYDPDSPLYHDAEYCREKLGLKDRIAYPSIACNDDAYMRTVDMHARDMMLVIGLNHTNIFDRPIYPGDTLYLVADERHVTDLTPAEGSVLRTLLIENSGRVYNQNGEVVNHLIWRVRENFKSFENGMPEGVRPWLEVEKEPNHVYTDEDYARFMEIWKNEKPRGDEILYWEDVNIGDQPNPTLDGPVVYGTTPCHEPGTFYGMGWGGHRPLKEEIMDPERRSKLGRDPELGYYYIKPAEGEEREPARPNGMNFTKRDFAIRHFYNWMGYHGWIKELSWTVLPGDTDLTPPIPEAPTTPKYLKDVPILDIDSENGFTQHYDSILVRSYVTGKRVVDGEYLVELAWWVESINGKITFAGKAVVRLPSRS